MDRINGMQVISSTNALVPGYQLSNFTKELMGEKWCGEFYEWAEKIFGKQPGVIAGHRILIVHPAILPALKEATR